MFDFSFGKLAIIFALCLIVLGPEKLPKLAATLGRFAGQARAMARHFRSQLEQEIAAEDLKKELKAADEAIAKIAALTKPVHTGIGEVVNEVSNSIDAHVSGMQAAAEAATRPLDISAVNEPFVAESMPTPIPETMSEATPPSVSTASTDPDKPTLPPA